MISANFRLVAATNRDLAIEVDAGRFRRDLYYRLLVCPLQLPALRERPQDVRPLFDHFWAARGEHRLISPDAYLVMESHPWPGNVRELQNLVERLSVCVDGPVIEECHLPYELRARLDGPRPSALPPSISAPTPMPRYSAPPPSVASMGTAVSSPLPSPPIPQTPTPRPSTPPADAYPVFTTSAPPPDEIAPMRPPPSPPITHEPAAVMPPLGDTKTLVLDASLPAISLTLPVNLPNIMRQLEEAMIDAALERSGGSRKAAADMLGLQRTTLVEKLRRRERDATGTASAA